MSYQICCCSSNIKQTVDLPGELGPDIEVGGAPNPGCEGGLISDPVGG